MSNTIDQSGQRTKKLNPRARHAFDARNQEAANVILQDVERYGGEASALVQWARLCTARLAATDDRKACA